MPMRLFHMHKRCGEGFAVLGQVAHEKVASRQIGYVDDVVMITQYGKGCVIGFAEQIKECQMFQSPHGI